MQAAIGRLQLAQLDDWLASRRHNAARLTAGFEDLPALRLTTPPPTVQHAFYKYYGFIRPERLKPGWDRDRVLGALAAEGVPGLSGSCPEIYLETAFADGGLPVLPVARELGETSFLLPVHPTLADADVDDMIHAVRKVLGHATA